MDDDGVDEPDCVREEDGLFVVVERKKKEGRKQKAKFRGLSA